MGDVFVAEDFNFCFGETAPSMMLAWLSSSERMKSSLRGCWRRCRRWRESGLEDDAGLDAFEGCDLFFELHVDAHGAGDGANSS